MSNLSNPLQNLINQAKKLKNSGTLEKYAERINANPIGKSVILLDVSGSMDEMAYQGMRKIDMLRQAMNRPLDTNEVVIAFHSVVEMIKDLQSIPKPGGGTALHKALEEAIKFSPKTTLVVCDGRPDSKDQALSAAKKLPGIINTLYIGRDDDLEAIQFMADLARTSCGVPRHCDVRYKSPAQLTEAIKLLLPNS